MTSEGIITAYRNRSDDEIRDNYVARLVNGKWSTPRAGVQRQLEDRRVPGEWPVAQRQRQHRRMSWFTVKNDQGQAYAAFSQDAGKTFSSPIRVDDGGTLGRVDMEMLPDGSALATWIEFARSGKRTAQFRVRRIERNGTRSAPVTIAGIAGSRASGYPRAAIANGEVVFAWTESADGGGAAGPHRRRANTPEMKRLLRIRRLARVPRDRRDRGRDAGPAGPRCERAAGALRH